MNDQDRFDAYPEQVRQVLHYAREEALHFQHHAISSEHLLLGLIREEHGVASHVLKSVGVDLSRARNCVDILLGRGKPTQITELHLSSRCHELLLAAVHEAEYQGQQIVGTEHLLLTLVREDEGIVASILSSLGIQPTTIRTKVLHEIHKLE